jgi:hypothetical protein
MIGQAATSAALTGFNTPPYYIKGIWIVLGSIFLMPPATVFGWWYLLRANRIKIKTRNEPEVNELRKKGLEELGSAHPDFKFSV